MPTAVTMPALGESVTEGTVTTWLKSVGDTVAVDEALVEVSTDKVDSEVPSPVAGVLLDILVKEDETVEVGTQIALIGDPSEATQSCVRSEENSAPLPLEAVCASTAPAGTASAGPTSSAQGIEVTMPALGESVTEGTVTTWLKAVGDAIEADEPLLEVSTDKVDSEVPSPASGFLTQICVQEDETVAVGTLLAVISTSAPVQSAPTSQSCEAPVSSSVPPAPAAPAQVAAPVSASCTASPASGAPTMSFDAPSVPLAPSSAPAVASEAPLPSTLARAGYVTPIVRKLAKEAGIDLTTVTGTGVGGRIRREDIEAEIVARRAAQNAVLNASASSKAPVPAGDMRKPSALRGTSEKMSRLRQTIARRMVDSLQTAAQLTTVIEVDVTTIATLRARTKDAFAAKHGTKLTFLPFFVKAATESLAYHPKINARIDDTTVTYFDTEHIGIAVDTPRGLLVPVIRDAGQKNIPALAASINDLAARTRDAQVAPDELSGSTFTITNTGSGGALFDTPVLNMPETAILGLGAIVKRPVVVKASDGSEAIAIRSMVYLSLSYDHRLVDGADASRYLMDVKKRLETGDFEADLALEVH